MSNVYLSSSRWTPSRACTRVQTRRVPGKDDSPGSPADSPPSLFACRASPCLLLRLPESNGYLVSRSPFLDRRCAIDHLPKTAERRERCFLDKLGAHAATPWCSARCAVSDEHANLCSYATLFRKRARPLTSHLSAESLPGIFHALRTSPLQHRSLTRFMSHCCRARWERVTDPSNETRPPFSELSERQVSTSGSPRRPIV